MDPAARGARRSAAAFAIGLGLAVAASPGVASADDTDSTSPDARPSQTTAKRGAAPKTTGQQQAAVPAREPRGRQRSAAIGNGRETVAKEATPQAKNSMPEPAAADVPAPAPAPASVGFRGT